MEPSIRFCTSSDGTQLAYATLGRGHPLVHVPGFSTNVELEWKDPESRAWMERVSAGRLLVRCQRRGVGASQRDVHDVSLRAQVEDLAAVIEHAGLKQVDILAAYDGAVVALAFAIANPGRILNLVLWGAYARGIDVNAAGAYDAMADLARQSWRLFLRTWADLCFSERPAGAAALVRGSRAPQRVSRCDCRLP